MDGVGVGEDGSTPADAADPALSLTAAAVVIASGPLDVADQPAPSPAPVPPVFAAFRINSAMLWASTRVHGPGEVRRARTLVAGPGRVLGSGHR